MNSNSIFLFLSMTSVGCICGCSGGGGGGHASTITGPTPSNYWSTMGVVADGVTDNTAALNALPSNMSIVGDCPAGSAIVAKSPWVWHSSLHVSIQPNCPIVSYVTGAGNGSFAITQSDLANPITDVYIDGLQISSHYAASADRIMQLWVNNFTLLHWTVTASGGVMFLRGSNQEIAYGTVTGTFSADGNPGIRHIGNEPKVPTTVGQPANVYIHDNTIVSGDAAYQACQPLATNLWTNVSSDDILFENNTGQSTASAFINVGEPATALGPFTAWTCSNIVFNNTSGSGFNRVVYIVSGGPSNVVSNITVQDSTLAASSDSHGSVGAFEVSAVGGNISTVSFANVSIKNVDHVALTTFGNVMDFSFDHGSIDPPNNGGSANVVISDTIAAGITNSTIGSNDADAIQVGPNDSTGAPHPASGTKISANVINGIANGFAGIRMLNVNLANITQNSIDSSAGASATTGIVFSANSAAGPGTTNSTATGNNLLGIIGNPTIIFAPNQGNSAIDNMGSPNY